MRSILLSAVLIVIAGPVVVRAASASALAFDSAADPAYAHLPSSGNLPNGVNGGYGWGSGWEGTGGSNFLDLSVVSTAGSTITSPVTSPGSMWVLPYLSGVFAGSPGAIRQFEGGLAPGQTFSFDSLYVSDIYLLDTNGKTVYWIDGGYEGHYQSAYYSGQSATEFQITVPFGAQYTEEGDHFSITPIDSNNAVLSITWYGPDGGTASVEMPYSDLGGVAFLAEKDFAIYVNNLSITPEPGASVLISAFGFGWLLRRRRKCRQSNAAALRA